MFNLKKMVNINSSTNVRKVVVITTVVIITIVVRQNGAIDGYVTVELWLPARQHALATTILNSLRLDS